MRTASFILRRGGLLSTEDSIPYNVYSKERHMLSPAILDSHSNNIGEYILWKFVANEGLLGCSTSDIPSLESFSGPSDLLRRAKASKGVTLKRVMKSGSVCIRTERQIKEEKRKKEVMRKHKTTDCLSSEMSNCQALVKPDCSKPKVLKSSGMQRALCELLVKCLKEDPHRKTNDEAHIDHFIQIDQKMLPSCVTDTTTFVSLEFAGIKFKAQASSGTQYLQNVERFILKPILCFYKCVKRIVICEEKYSFTPDDFKAATRQQRKRDEDRTISHLKTRDEIISKTSFDKGAIKTDEGKNLIGTYLGRHADEIKLKENVIIDIDSESQIAGCKCKDASSNCTCKTHAVPLRCYFSKNTGLEKVEKLTEVHQRKGEAELAQVDWLIQAVPQMKPGESAVSIVTSGDIDAIPIHLFALSFQLPRNEQNKFINNVFVVLQKTHGKSDIYNITSIIEVLENMYKDKYVAIKVSLGLCLGGNDFVPKFHGKSHATILRLLFESPNFRDSLFRVDRCTDNVIINFDKEVYIDFVKHLFYPKTRNATQLSFEDVRVITIYGSKLKKST